MLKDTWPTEGKKRVEIMLLVDIDVALDQYPQEMVAFCHAIERQAVDAIGTLGWGVEEIKTVNTYDAPEGDND